MHVDAQPVEGWIFSKLQHISRETIHSLAASLLERQHAVRQLDDAMICPGAQHSPSGW
jgi:hypothetical protein